MPPDKIPPELEEQLKEALRAGRKDEAIRLLQEGTGISPKAAKATVFLISMTGIHRGGDSAESEGPTQPTARTDPTPSRTSRTRPGGTPPRGAVQSSSGCGSVVLLAVGLPFLWILLSL